jgi:hypothetical protein
MQTPFERYPQLSTYQRVVEEQKTLHIEIGHRLVTAGGGAIHIVDLVMMGVLKRSLDLLGGAIVLVEQWNFTAAAPMLRLQLDNSLKLVYLRHAPDAGLVAQDILSGKQFNKLKDSDNKPLTDARLREYARPYYPWIDSVYEQTSKMIHFPNKHCFFIAKAVDEETRTVKFVIEEGLPDWPEAELDEFLHALTHSTEALLKIIEGWVQSKGAISQQLPKK